MDVMEGDSKVDSLYFLTTQHLGFRCWANDDFGLALELWGDPEVTQFIDARGHLSDDQVRVRLSKEIATERVHGIQYWPIFLLESDEHVGCCGLRPYGESRQVLEIGFHIRVRHWGCGYATEAARATIAYAFESLSAKALVASHNPANDASRHLVQKLGFRYMHDEYYEPTSLDHPSYLLAAEEFADAEGHTAWRAVGVPSNQSSVR
jgi:ribosomal-protein-alanine N-acetyltransferase